MKTKEKIIEEFREEFGELSEFQAWGLKKRLENFITKSLSKQKQEIVGEIETMKYFIPVSKGIPIIEYQREMRSYTRAIDEIIKLLKREIRPSQLNPE